MEKYILHKKKDIVEIKTFSTVICFFQDKDNLKAKHISIGCIAYNKAYFIKLFALTRTFLIF